jgi:HAD superfamily hydrolase (TIGR01490 family)
LVDNESGGVVRHASIGDAFAGARVLVTGASGFLGTALVAKILTSLGAVEEIILIVRSKPGAPAAERVQRRVLGSNAFEALRARDDWDALASKVTTLDGDLREDKLGLTDDDLARLASVDIVIHCAATVAFDAPVDDAFETNLLGPIRLLDALEAAGTHPKRIIHVSTAYVAGLVKGHVPEAPWTETPGRPRLDWRAELASARQSRASVEAESRTPEKARGFAKEARRHTGPAGAPAIAAKAEQLRREWVSDRLVEMGRGRAQSLGWPDAYSFTKALAEMAVLERKDRFSITIVRPSIIESALAEPSPGWVRGFRMADPIILAYGRGSLPEFPGIPDAVVDVVPVDLVVNGMLAAVAADPPEPVVHVATGARKPMLYRDLVLHVHDYFHEHPYLDEDGQPILPELWKFPGRRSVERRLKLALRALDAGSRVFDRLKGERFADRAERIDELLDELKQAEKYSQLYGGYAESEAVFDDERLRALAQMLSPQERAIFPMDADVIDWRAYLHDLHLPEITRRRGVVRRRSRPSPRSQLKPGGGKEVLAVFDLEGTVLGTNVIDTYLWIRLAASPRNEWAKRIFDLARSAPGLLAAERRDRGEFLRKFYRRYDGAPVDEINRLAAQAFNETVLPNAFPAGMRRIREHRAAGHRVVILTGALDFTIAPMTPLADIVACARLRQENGRYKGELEEVPYAGDARAAYLRRLAKEVGADLSASYAYGDSISDLPMLESVGNPVAVNPDPRLRRIARDRRWAVERWREVEGTGRFSPPVQDARWRAPSRTVNS